MAPKFTAALADLMRLLDTVGHPGIVIGGIAVIAHGFARTTGDIDASVLATPDDIESILRCAKRVGFAPRVTHAADFARENLVLLLRHQATGVPLDLSLGLQAFELEAAESAVERSFAGVRVRVPNLTSLLIYKLVAARPKDMEDARALLATGERFDAAHVERTLAEFDELLETNRAEDFRALVRRR